MSNDKLEKLSRKIGSMTLGAKKERLVAITLLHKSVLVLLAEEKPASSDELAAITGQSKKEIEKMIPQLPNAELDSHGRVLGVGLTLLPTPHRVQLNNRDQLLYAWCGPDALILPGLINESATVYSPCHATGKLITVEVEPTGIIDVHPPEAVVSWWPDAIDPDNLRPTGCKNQNFFSSSNAASNWLAEHPKAFTLSVTETYQIVSQAYERFVTQGSCC